MRGLRIEVLEQIGGGLHGIFDAEQNDMKFSFKKKNVLLIILLPMIAGCYFSTNNKIYDFNEVVITEGMSITAQNLLYGTIIITAGKGLERSYTWAGDTRTVIMWPRKERWYGSLGIYYPGPGRHWREHDGITRAVLNEGQQNFDSLDALLEYIKSYNNPGAITYNDNGLFVSWHKKSGAGGTLTVTVWQFLISGKFPTKIPGSLNDNITQSMGL